MVVAWRSTSSPMAIFVAIIALMKKILAVPNCFDSNSILNSKGHMVGILHTEMPKGGSVTPLPFPQLLCRPSAIPATSEPTIRHLFPCPLVHLMLIRSLSPSSSPASVTESLPHCLTTPLLLLDYYIDYLPVFL
jgi:hypothetical protein